eukprot:359008-Chlamydomonas_euryale.AAC.2
MSRVFAAACPTKPVEKSDAEQQTVSDEASRPSSSNISPMRRATVVFPVPAIAFKKAWVDRCRMPTNHRQDTLGCTPFFVRCYTNLGENIFTLHIFCSKLVEQRGSVRLELRSDHAVKRTWRANKSEVQFDDTQRVFSHLFALLDDSLVLIKLLHHISAANQVVQRSLLPLGTWWQEVLRCWHSLCALLRIQVLEALLHALGSHAQQVVDRACVAEVWLAPLWLQSFGGSQQLSLAKRPAIPRRVETRRLLQWKCPLLFKDRRYEDKSFKHP